MYCPKCGKKCNDQDTFCNQCGYKFNKVTDHSNTNNNYADSFNNRNFNQKQNNNVSKQPVQNYQQPVPINSNYPAEYNNSYFDGTGIQLAGWNFLCRLLSVVTFGFGIPFACCLKIRWETKHTIINGKRLYFNGTALQLFGKVILWGLILGTILIAPVIVARYMSYVNYSDYFYSGTYFSSTKFLSFLPLIVIFDLLVGVFGNAFFSVYIKKWIVKHTTSFYDRGLNYNSYALAGNYVNGYNQKPQGGNITTENINPKNYSNNNSIAKTSDTPKNNTETGNISDELSNKNESNLKSGNIIKKENSVSNNLNIKESFDVKTTENFDLKSTSDVYDSNYNLDNNSYNYKENMTDVKEKNYNDSRYISDNYENEKIYCPTCSAEIEYGIESCPHCGSVFRWD